MAEDQEPIFAALADPTRRAIYQRLAGEGPANVRRLTAGAGISQPATSKHLAVLLRAGLVTARRRGRETDYAASEACLGPLIDWIGETSPLWRARIRRMVELLAERGAPGAG